MNNFCHNCRNYPGEGKICTTGDKLIEKNNLSCGHFSPKEAAAHDEVETINPGDKLFPETDTIEILRKDQTGTLTVIDRLPKGSSEGVEYVILLGKLQKLDKEHCPYTYRYV